MARKSGQRIGSRRTSMTYGCQCFSKGSSLPLMSCLPSRSLNLPPGLYLPIIMLVTNVTYGELGNTGISNTSTNTFYLLASITHNIINQMPPACIDQKERLQDALCVYQNKLFPSLKAAAVAYNVPKSSLANQRHGLQT